MSDNYYADRQAFQDYAAGLRRNQLARQVGPMLTRGDVEGGRNVLWNAGLVDEGYKLDAQVQAQKKARLEKAREWSDGLARVLSDPRFSTPEGAQEAWKYAESVAPRYGIDPGEMAQEKARYDSNPQAWAAMFGKNTAQELEFIKGGDGSYSAVPKMGDGRPVYQYRAPTPDRYEQWDPEKEVRRIPGQPGRAIVGGEQGPETTGAGPLPSPRGTPGFNPNAPPPTAPPNLAALTSRGARVTSGVRTPEQNARVGGVPNSYHLASRGGLARDLVPPAGVSMAQFHQDVRGNLPPGWEAINEGDHIHIEPSSRRMAQASAAAPQSDGGPEIVRRAQPKASSTPPSGFRWKADGSLEPIPGGPADTISQGGKVTEGERTAGFLASRLADSLKNLSALSASTPGADKPGLGEIVTDVMTKGRGTNLVRGAERQQVVANQLDVLDAALTLGTGAAYTREQLENYRETYFPALTDKPATVLAKRQKLISLLNAAKIKAGRSAPPELETALAAARQQWAPQSGARPAAAAPAQDKQATGLPAQAAQQLKAGHNTTFANGQVWTLRNGKPARVR